MSSVKTLLSLQGKNEVGNSTNTIYKRTLDITTAKKQKKRKM